VRSPRILLHSLIALLSVAIPMTVRAQTDNGKQPQSRSARAEQVLDKFVQAVGDSSQCNGANTIYSKGTIVNWQSEKIPFEGYFKCPNKSVVIEHKSHGDTRRGCNEKGPWIQEGSHAPKRVKPSYDQENEVAFRDIVHWRETFKKIYFSGEANVLDRKTYVLAVTGRRPATLYFDQETGFLLRKDTKWDRSPVVIYYSDYVEGQGAKRPWRTDILFTKTRQQYIAKTAEMRTNIPVDDAIFEMPTP